MPDLIKITIVFLLILLLLRKRINVGLVMSAASVILFVLYQMPFISVFETCRAAALNAVTIKLILALSLIRMFEMILREKAVLGKMMETAKALFRNRKVVTVSMPLMIGLMPSIGGAYFSAPMVAESTIDTKMRPEEKGFINYWFRHPWEYILPLYPGILLASAVSKIELRSLIMLNMGYVILMILTGFFFAMRSMKGSVRMEERFSGKDLWSFAPIFAVLILVVIFHIELHYALICAVLFLFFFYRYPPSAALKALRYGFALDVIILILGVMLFKEAMENSGAVKNLSLFFIAEGIPVTPIFFLLPFITGLLTGITVGFVGSTFPLIISIAGDISPGTISFAFVSGFLGVLLSPVHICLILTRDYFKADLWKMYKMMIPGCAIIFTGAVIQYWFLK
jgi:uncharacterized protein